MNITEIVQMAKDHLLKHKEHTPTVYVERTARKGELELDVVILTWLADTAPERQAQFFTVARDLAREKRWDIKTVQEVCFVVEAWMSVQRPDNRYDAPSEDPERKEVLTISRLTTKPFAMTMQRIEMLRDGSGDLVDLLPLAEVTPCSHTLLPAFLAGIASRTYSDKALSKMIIKKGNKQR